MYDAFIEYSNRLDVKEVEPTLLQCVKSFPLKSTRVSDNLLSIFHQTCTFQIKKYTNYREMIEIEKPELVAIATESGKHAAKCVNYLFC